MSLTNAVINEQRWKLKRPLPSGHNAPMLYINKYLTTMIDLNYIDEVVLRWGSKDLSNTITSIICIALTVDLGIVNAWSFKDNIHESVVLILNNYNI